MKYLICYIENITKHVFQKLLKAMTMAVLLSLLAAGLLPAGTVSAEESASFSWYNPETGYDILIEDDAALLTTEEKNLLADTMERVSYYGNVAFKSIDYNPQSTSSYARSYFHETFGSGLKSLFTFKILLKVRIPVCRSMQRVLQSLPVLEPHDEREPVERFRA